MLGTKDEIIDTLINCRITDLDTILNECSERNTINVKTKERVEDFINRMNGGDESLRRYHVEEIKLLLFNSKDKITDDISLMLTINDDETI